MSDMVTIHVQTVSPDGSWASEGERAGYTSTGTGWLTDGRHVRRAVQFKVPPGDGHRTSYTRAAAIARELLANGEATISISPHFLTFVGEPGTGY
jgi:hypothetical protein